jgi:hypothetical protein
LAKQYHGNKIKSKERPKIVNEEEEDDVYGLSISIRRTVYEEENNSEDEERRMNKVKEMEEVIDFTKEEGSSEKIVDEKNKQAAKEQYMSLHLRTKTGTVMGAHSAKEGSSDSRYTSDGDIGSIGKKSGVDGNRPGSCHSDT